MRRRSKKFDPHALAFIGGVAEKYDAAFLFFLRKWIGEDEHGAHIERLVQIHQAAVGVDHDRFASLAEAAVIGVLPRNHHAHPHEDPGTASDFVNLNLRHDRSMLRQFGGSVNGAVARMFLQCNMGLTAPDHPAWVVGKIESTSGFDTRRDGCRSLVNPQGRGTQFSFAGQNAWKSQISD